MIRTLFRTLMALLLCLPLISSAQNQKTGLLWRISGNGLSGASYLYGTMHLKDKKLFSFPDSLYAAIEQTEGFAIELHPDSIVRAALDEYDDSRYVSELLSPADFNRIKKKMESEFDRKPEKITLRELQTFCSQRYYRVEAENSMNTFMDTYLYSAASRLGKWTGGIEDVEDQMGLQGRQSPQSVAYEFMETDKVIRTRMDSMINIYLKGNADFMAFMTSGDSIMIKRNHKMTLRMDSMMHLRTMVFAIGAAHLTGKKGVVGLLKEKGYTVEPVVHSKREFILDHSFNFKETPWVTVNEKKGLYTVQLPGESSREYEIPGTDGGVRVYVDLRSGLSYFTFVSLAKKDLNYDTLAKDLLRRIDSRILASKSSAIRNGEVEGKEFLAESKEAVVRLQLFIVDGLAYGAYVTYTPTALIMTSDIEKFFSSFSVKRPTAEMLAERTPRNFSSDESGFKVHLPVKPVVRREASESSVTWQYAALDMEHENGFLIMVQHLSADLTFINDSTQFAAYTQNIRNMENGKLLKEQRDTFAGFPANWIDFTLMLDGEKIFYRTLNVLRGKRNYYFMAYSGSEARLNEAAVEYFKSISFYNLISDAWQTQTVPGGDFSVWSPAPFKKEENSNNSLEYSSWVSMDTLNAVSIIIHKEPHSPYLKVSSDTAYLRSAVMEYIGYGHELLNFKFTRNGNFQSAEAESKYAEGHTRKKMRCVFDNQSVYCLFAIGDQQSLEQPGIARMFESFTLAGSADYTELYKSKAAILLKALASDDSATSFRAFRRLPDLEFSREDLPLLYAAMKETYRENLYNVYGNIGDAIRKTGDSSSIGELSKLYRELDPAQDKLRMEILNSILLWQTAGTHKLTAELFLADPPKTANMLYFMYKFYDSIELAAPWYHKFMTMINDSGLVTPMMNFTRRMIENKQLQPTDLKPYRQIFFNMAGKVSAAKTDEANENIWYYDDLAMVLTFMRDPAAIASLKKMFSNPTPEVKLEVIMGLLSIKQPLPPAELLKVAADRGTRFSLYDTLSGAGKLLLFPKNYLNQKAFGESSLYHSMEDDEYGLKSITFIGEKVVYYKKGKKKFYMYKVNYEFEDGKNSYLGVTGPYSITPGAKLVQYGDVDRVLFDEEYDAAKLEDMLKKYLKEIEQYSNE